MGVLDVIKRKSLVSYKGQMDMDSKCKYKGTNKNRSKSKNGMRKSYAKIPFLLLLTPFVTQCVSAGGKEKTKRLYTPVLQSKASEKNELSRLSRSDWIHVKKVSSHADHFKLYANLGARAFDVAIHDARLYLVKNPKNVHGLTVLATALAMTGKHQLAGYYASVLERHHPGLASTMNLKGIAKIHDGLHAERSHRAAAYYFAKAMERESGHVASALNLGSLYLKMGRNEKALFAFKKAQKRCDKCLPSLLGYATALVRTGRYGESREIFEGILAKNPSNLEAHYRLAIIALYKDKDRSEAREHLEFILSSSSDGRLDMQRKANILMRKVDTIILVNDK